MSQIPNAYDKLDTIEVAGQKHPVIKADSLTQRGIITALCAEQATNTREVLDAIESDRKMLSVVGSGADSNSEGQMISHCFNDDMSELVEKSSTVEEFAKDNAKAIEMASARIQEFTNWPNELCLGTVVLQLVPQLRGCGIEQAIKNQTNLDTVGKIQDHKGIDFSDGGQCKALTCKNRWYKVAGYGSAAKAKDKEAVKNTPFEYVVYYHHIQDGVFYLSFDIVGDYSSGITYGSWP